ncbi:hypothetical protein HOK68_05360 [Candidatus Woesearchaeota archaeon]|jgi:serine/threonine protein kinase|nr:hypothetical protein [Candidatus Woesearchaeota archaeon]MBT4387417.1 hypothetical protein [Candidatus Woesearchaeota archaeon]MBT4595794.1 hypothetical protein [Candidatus Woesearchaeota archaeon]MBT5741357.1 hypothetical protein [Candidatus Woesearchaeota archaeon]MBT6506178.1 hypothetical protein [Candidatus Woesearchaeota archaeon]
MNLEQKLDSFVEKLGFEKDGEFIQGNWKIIQPVKRFDGSKLVLKFQNRKDTAQIQYGNRDLSNSDLIYAGTLGGHGRSFANLVFNYLDKVENIPVIVEERVECTLNQLKLNKTEDIFDFIKDITNGINDLHNNVVTSDEKSGWIHADIKPENIGYVKGAYKLTDFEGSQLEDNAIGQIGDIHYRAPELFDENNVATKQCDFYSFGATLYHVITGRKLFEGEFFNEEEAKIKVNSLSEYWDDIIFKKIEHLNSHYSFLLKKLLCKKEKRVKDSKELIDVINKAHKMYESKKPINILKRWGKIGLAASFAIGTFIHNGSYELKLKKVEAKQEFERKKSTVYEFVDGDYGKNINQRLEIAKLKAYTNYFEGDKHMAITAYFNPRTVARSILDTNSKKYEDNKKNFETHIESTYFFVQYDLNPAFDRFIMYMAEETRKKSIENFEKIYEKEKVLKEMLEKRGKPKTMTFKGMEYTVYDKWGLGKSEQSPNIQNPF